MARRKDHTREELTQLAIQCGKEIITAEGVSALTARNVAKHMGYTPGTLYNLFENIEGLMLAINIETLQDFAGTLDQIIRSTSKPKKRIRKIAEAYLALQEQRPQLWALLFATPIQAHSETYHEAIHAVFDPVVQIMEFISGSPAARQDAKVLWATLHGICLLKQNGKLDVTDADTPKILVKQFLAQFLNR